MPATKVAILSNKNFEYNAGSSPQKLKLKGITKRQNQMKSEANFDMLI